LRTFYLSDAYIFNPRNDSSTKVQDVPEYLNVCTTLLVGTVFICGKWNAYIYNSPFHISPVHVGELAPTPSPQGSFQAKAEVMEAWLADAESVLLSAQTQLDDSEKMLNQQCDVRVARAQEEHTRAIQEAERVREQAIQEAE